MLPKFLAKLPRLRQFDVRNESQRPSSRRYHPTLLQSCSTMLRAFAASPSLSVLSLTDTWFTSTSDVLRVISLFPRLAHVTLARSTIHHTSTSRYVPSSSLDVVTILVEECFGHGPAIPAFALRWQSQHNPADSQVPGNIRRLTCERAREIARQGKQRFQTDGILSPLWFSGQRDDAEREEWCVSPPVHSVLQLMA